MKRIITSALLAMLLNQESSASNNNSNNDSVPGGDENRLRSVLAEILPNVHVGILGHEVKLTGTERAIDEAIAKLRDFQALREVLLPMNNSKSLAVAKAKDVKNWDDFLDAAGVDLSLNQLFNTKANCVSDVNGSLIVETITKPNQRMFQAYLDSLQESSQFFAWARTNVPNFVVQHADRTTIHYGILSDFLYLHTDALPLEDRDEAIATFSTQNVVKSLVAAVSGNMALKAVANGQYRVQAISLGERYDVRVGTLEIMVDRSTSMANAPISFVNRQLPILLDNAKKALSDGESLKIRLKAFDHQVEDIGTYFLRKNEMLPRIPEIPVRGETDLTLIEPLLNELDNERKLVIAFTDGEHTMQSKNLPDSIARMRKLVATGKFAQVRLCKVGQLKSTYFDQVAAIFGGQYSTEDNVQQFFTTITEELKSLMRAKSPLVVQLAGQDVTVVEWIPDDEPGVYQSKQVVSEGASVKFKGVQQKVEKPAVDQTALIKKLETTLAELKEAQRNQ